MRETGRISNIEGKMITVFCGEIAACFGCMNQECKSNKRMITAENCNHLELSPGQFVEIESTSRAAFIQFIEVLLPPALGFAAAYFFTRFVFPHSAYGLQAAVGLAGLFLAGFAAYQYRKKVPAKNNPKVIRVLDASANN